MINDGDDDVAGIHARERPTKTICLLSIMQQCGQLTVASLSLCLSSLPQQSVTIQSVHTFLHILSLGNQRPMCVYRCSQTSTSQILFAASLLCLTVEGKENLHKLCNSTPKADKISDVKIFSPSNMCYRLFSFLNIVEGIQGPMSVR